MKNMNINLIYIKTMYEELQQTTRKKTNLIEEKTHTITTKLKNN